MIISKKLFFFLIFFAILTALILSFSLNFFWKPVNPQTLSVVKEHRGENIQVLINDLHSGDSLTRRNAIITLGKQRATGAILPIFSMLMDTFISDMEAELCAEALYSITEGKVLEYVVQLLSMSVEKNSRNSKKKPSLSQFPNVAETKPLNPTQIIHLIEILNLSNKDEIEKGKYDLSFLSQFLDSNNSAIVLATLGCISNLVYEPLYEKVQGLYNKNLYYKIPVVQILTKIGLNSEKYYSRAMNFVRNQILEEEHPNVQEENYLSLYMLIQHLLEIPEETEKFMRHIVGLDAPLLDASLAQESFLLAHHIPREEISLVKFFLSDFVSPNIRSRLLNILWKQNDTDFLETTLLFKNLQERYADTKGKSSHLEIAKTSLQILADRVEKREDLVTILNYLGDSRLGFSVVSAVERMMNTGKNISLLQDLYHSIVEDAYSNPAFVSWLAYLGYRLQGEEGLEKQLLRASDKEKLMILHDIADCHISEETVSHLSNLYVNKGEVFQKTLEQFSTGHNVCFFG